MGESTESTENDDFSCKWTDCAQDSFDKQAHLVNHLNSSHVAHLAHLTPNTPIRYSCQWEGCGRFGMEQPSKFALLSHCRTHTGEKPYFCPVPECEKHFIRSDALAKHVKGVHGLYDLKELMRVTEMVDMVTSEEYLSLIEKDYEFKNPWWFSSKFVDLLAEGLVDLRKGHDPENHYDHVYNDGDSIDPKQPVASSVKVDVKSLYNLPYDFTQHKVAQLRYFKYVRQSSEDLIDPMDEKNRSVNVIHRQQQLIKVSRGEPVEILPTSDPLHQKLHNDSIGLREAYDSKSEDFEDVENLAQLEEIYQKLTTRLHTANRINKVVSTQLAGSLQHKRKLWLMNQLLIDANVEIGLPPEPSVVPQRVTQDHIDEELYQ